MDDHSRTQGFVIVGRLLLIVSASQSVRPPFDSSLGIKQLS